MKIHAGRIVITKCSKQASRQEVEPMRRRSRAVRRFNALILCILAAASICGSSSTRGPGLAATITQTIVDGLAVIAPEHRAAFEQNRKSFLAQLDGVFIGRRASTW